MLQGCNLLRSYKNYYWVLLQFAGHKSVSLQTIRIAIWETKDNTPSAQKEKNTPPQMCTHVDFFFPQLTFLVVGTNWEEAEKSRQATKSGIAILSALLKTVGVQVLFLLSWAMGEEDAVCKQPPP